MLLVVVLLSLSLAMYDGEFDHSGGGFSCGGPAAEAVATVAAVEAVEDNLSAKAAGKESVDGRMTACDDEIGRWTTTQQPTNERRQQRQRQRPRQRQWRQLDSARSAATWRRRSGVGGITVAAHSAMAAALRRRRTARWWQQRGGCGGGGSATSWRRRQLGGGAAVAAARQRHSTT